MKCRSLVVLFLAITIYAMLMLECGQDEEIDSAYIELGMNDETLLSEQFGVLTMIVRRIEIPYGGDYITVWENTRVLDVELHNSDFTTVTDGYVEIRPIAIANARLTVDSLAYVQETLTTVLLDTSLSFVAEAFTPIIVSSDDRKQIVAVIASDVWFDADSVRIIPGHQPFENAALRVFYTW